MRHNTPNTSQTRSVAALECRVTIYTDGACDPNPGPGGWGAILISGDNEQELSGVAIDTTNNRMELRAVIEGLRAIKYPCHVTVWSDSEYLRQGVTQWLPKWQARGWRTSGNRPVANQDLWRELEVVMQTHEIGWHWVKGHAGHPLNERADKLARSFLASLEIPVDDPTDAHVFTGASCDGSRGPGGWAAVVREGEQGKVRSGRESTTTANRLHVLAACEGLKVVASSKRVHVYTPSDYLQKGASLWLRGWQRRGWRTKGGHPVKNRDAWQAVADASVYREVVWHVAKAGARPLELRQAWKLASRAAR